MSKKTKHIFILIFICSVFSLTMQASIINFCKENKCFLKSQNQQNNIDSEEKAQDSDDTSKEVEYLRQDGYKFYSSQSIICTVAKLHLQLHFPSNTIKIQIPPPKQ